VQRTDLALKAKKALKHTSKCMFGRTFKLEHLTTQLERKKTDDHAAEMQVSCSVGVRTLHGS